jgi:hypothetical protein
MTLSINQINEFANNLVSDSNKHKQIVIDQIVGIVSPYFHNTGYTDKSNYVNGFLPKDAERTYIQIADLPHDLYLPEILVNSDTQLSHVANDKREVNVQHISKDGLLIDDHCFSDFYSHSLDTLKVILAQITNMRTEFKPLPLSPETIQKNAIIDEIQSIVKPYLYTSNFQAYRSIDSLNEEKPSNIQLAHLPSLLKIPKKLYSSDKSLSHYSYLSNDNGDLTTKFVAVKGVLLDSGCATFSDYHAHSTDVLNNILEQLISMKPDFKK